MEGRGEDAIDRAFLRTDVDSLEKFSRQKK
jgi:hypothetical protein